MKPALACADSALLALIEQARKEWPALSAGSEDAWERALAGPVREFLRRPGKTFRAQLVAASWRLAGGASGAMPELLPLIVELIHAGSLIIDDIEDGSASRRGEPALHHLFGTPTALNAGNWLYFFPLCLIPRLGVSPEVELAIYRRATCALARCHEGQALDLALRMGELPQREIPCSVALATELKTGGLMELAAALGAEAAGGRTGVVSALAEFGRQLGIGLQMLDDLGGLLSERRSDKAIEDLLHGRPTWPWAWLAEDLGQLRFAALQQRARQLSGESDARQLAASMREELAGQGRLRVRSHLSRIVTDLRVRLDDHDALRPLEAEIERLEASYG